jgi:DegV family protein with EDD domain
MKVGIITSSVSCVPYDLVQKYDIRVVPLPFMLDGRSYLDGIDISATEVYQQLAYELPFRTSAPSPAAYLKTYNDVLETCDAALCLTIPAKLSMMYNAALQAAKEMPKNKVVNVIDTGNAAGGQALIDVAAAEAASAGAELVELEQLVSELKSKVHLYGLIVAPKYLARTGRVPAPLPSAASALNIKPIFTIAQGGVRLAGIVRSEKSGMNRIISMMHSKAAGNPISVIIQHANAPQEAQTLRELVESEFNCKELHITEFSPIIGFATGPGSLVIAFRVHD